jgi:tetraacyldisaccharide 4'-kinase
MYSHLEKYVVDVIKGYHLGIHARIARGVLRCLSWPFKIMVACRNWAFDHGWLRRYFPPVPVVISVGNIVAGGTGKTPVTLMIAEEFYNDFRIAVLSRGYCSRAEKLSTPVMMSVGGGPIHPASFCGDEPYLISQHLPKAFIIVGKNRHQASYMAAKAGAQLILLDDGMQHRSLARDFEVVVMDFSDPFGKGYFLPRGFLREGLHSLARADLIILNHVDDQKKYEGLEAKITRYSSAPIIGTRMEISQVIDCFGQAIPSLKNKSVGIFCGIAHPEYFHETVSSQGAHIVETMTVGDHRHFEPSELAHFAVRCKEKGAELLLCTEKDMVKLLGQAGQFSLPVAWIQVRLQLVAGEEKWKSFIQRTKSDLMRRI